MQTGEVIAARYSSVSTHVSSHTLTWRNSTPRLRRRRGAERERSRADREAPPHLYRMCARGVAGSSGRPGAHEARTPLRRHWTDSQRRPDYTLVFLVSLSSGISIYLSIRVGPICVCVPRWHPSGALIHISVLALGRLRVYYWKNITLCFRRRTFPFPPTRFPSL